MENIVNQSEITKISLEGIRKVINPSYFKPNMRLAVESLLVGVLFHVVTIFLSYLVWKQDWYWLYPITWFLAGTSVTSLFVLGHDCAHGSFFKSNRWNDILGHFVFLFSFYPYFAWKYSHNAHHRHTNLLKINSKDIYYDNAWIPLKVSQYQILKRFQPRKALIYKLGRLFPPFGSFMHNVLTHFYPSKFNESQRKKVIFSYVVLAIGFIGISSLIYAFTKSVFLVFHLYIIPALFFQFWMSLYTYQHHTSTEIDFYNEKEWNSYKGQILSTLNSLSPKWLSFLHFGIDVHTPHHLSTGIPCYYLHKAYQNLKDSAYAEDLKERKLSLRYYWKQISQCHLWDEKQKRYVSFSDLEKNLKKG